MVALIVTAVPRFIGGLIGWIQAQDWQSCVTMCQRRECLIDATRIKQLLRVPPKQGEAEESIMPKLLMQPDRMH